MKKEALLRGLLGVPLGIALGHIISLLASLGLAGGEFSPCVPSLVQAMGSEVAAVALQTGLSGLLGAAFGAGSVVWSLDHWSLVKQTGVYFLIGSLAMLPSPTWPTGWSMNLRGILGYFLIYLGDFRGIWAIQYLTRRAAASESSTKNWNNIFLRAEATASALLACHCTTIRPRFPLTRRTAAP